MKVKVSNYLSSIQEIALSLPSVIEKTCFGTAGFYVDNKLLARLKEDGETLAVFTPDRDVWISKETKTFYITDHYKNHPYVLVRLNTISKEDLETLLKEAWESRACRKTKAKNK